MKIRNAVKAAFISAMAAVAAVGIATPASATSSAGSKVYNLSLEYYVQTSSTTTKTTFTIMGHTCNSWGLPCQVGHGSIERSGSVWYLVVCDDKADGIGPYIDRDGGSYGASGNGTCGTVYAVPSQWRVRWNGWTTPWFTRP
ncbi:hypothetical protein ABZ461_09520 [Actinacidiphila glaucinigra]|uniref:hypothetical protein n=1 Tax=Actinacidiphila glaucinigra TaxID=235986 RepID=UPI003408DFC8